MIHVDHHPSTLPKTSNKNDILWSHQKPFTQDFLPQRSDTPSSPTSPPDGNSISPAREERSSSLSPSPELTNITSPSMVLAEEKEAPSETLQREEEEEEDPSLNVRAEVEEDEEFTHSHKTEEAKAKESRQSTPLSELSSPPDEPDEHDSEPAADTQAADIGSSSSPQPRRTSSPPKSAVGNTRSDSSNSTRTLRSMSSKSPTHLQSQPQPQPQPQAQPTLPPSQQQALIPSTSSNHTPPNDHVTPTTVSSTPALLQDPKVVSILDLNVELLKICIIFQSKGVPTSDARFGQYSQRLQSNLTWLAAAADHGRQGNRSAMPLPVMDVPTPIALQALDTPHAERISRMYTELPAVFAKEIVRRQQSGLLGVSGGDGGGVESTANSNLNHVSTTPTSPPGSVSLKRERSDDGIVGPGPGSGGGGDIGDAHGMGISGMMSNKRRDTGEGKMSMGLGSPPSSAGSGSSSGLPHQSQSPLSAAGTQGGSTTSFQQQQQLQQLMLQQQQQQNMQNRGEAMMMPPPSIPMSISSNSGPGPGPNSHASASGGTNGGGGVGGVNLDMNMNPTITGGTSFSVPISMNGHHQQQQSSSSLQQGSQQQHQPQQPFMSQQQLHQQRALQPQQQIGRMPNNTSGGGSSRSSASFSPSLVTSSLPPSNRISGPNSAGLSLGGLGSGLGLGLGQGGSNPGNSSSESSNPNELLTLPGSSNPINTTEAQMAASMRERARQAQIRIAHQQAHAQQGMSIGMGNMPGMSGVTGMGAMGMGNMGGIGGNMSGMGNMGGGMNNMSGMGGNMSQGMAGMQQGMGMQRQMSPGHGGGGPQSQGQGMMGGGNAIAGPSNLGLGIGGQNQGSAPGQGGVLNQAQLQAFQILNMPGHPLLQYLIKNVPGFESMPPQQQVQKMIMSRAGFQNRHDQQLQQQQQMQQQMAAAMNRTAGGMGNMQSGGGSGMGSMSQQQQNHMGGGGSGAFGQNQGQGQGSPVSSLSPVQHQSSNPNIQGQLFSQGMGMGMGSGGGGGGGSVMGGMGTMDPRMAMGNMNSQQQQRQLLLMQQQQRVGNGMGGSQFNVPPGSMNPMMMNAQQQQQVAFQRQQQQQGQGQGAMNSSSPTHPGSPMVQSDFSGPSGGGPPMRSSSAIPGIARRTRSPSDGVPSPMMARGMPTRVGQEEYQRIMMQQQHGQAVRSMSTQSPAFNQHQQMMAGGGSSNWSQQGGGSNYGMSSSDNTSGFGGGGDVGVPANSGQSWNTATQGGYPFAPSPSASEHVRNMPATSQQNQGTTHDSPSTDQNITSDFDLFNWNA